MFCLALSASLVTQAQPKKNIKDQIQQSEKAAQVFREIMGTPDKGIPQELLELEQGFKIWRVNEHHQIDYRQRVVPDNTRWHSFGAKRPGRKYLSLTRFCPDHLQRGSLLRMISGASA